MAYRIKRSKSDRRIQYQWTPKDGERCGKCSMYVVPRECTHVSGDISPRGWCRIFDRKK